MSEVRARGAGVLAGAALVACAAWVSASHTPVQAAKVDASADRSSGVVAAAPCDGDGRIRVALSPRGRHGSALEVAIVRGTPVAEWDLRIKTLHGSRRIPVAQDFNFPTTADPDGVVKAMVKMTWDERTRFMIRATEDQASIACELRLRAAAR